MKRIVALLLVLLCVFCTACGKEPQSSATPDTATPDTVPTTEPTETEPVTEPTTLANDLFDPAAAEALIGTWQTIVTLDGALFNLVDMEAKVEMKLIYQLGADGTYFRGVDPAEYKTAMEQYAANVEAFLVDRLYATFTAEKLIEKVSKKKIPELWEKEGKADAEVQAQRFVEGLHLDYRFSGLNGVSGDYYLQDGKLMFSTQEGSYEPCGYELTDKGLTVTTTRNQEIYKQLKLELPLVLTKAE